MKPFSQFPPALSRQVRFVLTDVDDTLTDGPRLPASAYAAIERLQGAGITVIPVTAAPAGWCDLIARMWPIGAVIGEFIGSNDGLGNLMLVANSQINMPLAFAALFGLAILGVALYTAVVAVEWLLDPWFGDVTH